MLRLPVLKIPISLLIPQKVKEVVDVAFSLSTDATLPQPLQKAVWETLKHMSWLQSRNCYPLGKQFPNVIWVIPKSWHVKNVHTFLENLTFGELTRANHFGSTAASLEMYDSTGRGVWWPKALKTTWRLRRRPKIRPRRDWILSRAMEIITTSRRGLCRRSDAPTHTT